MRAKLEVVPPYLYGNENFEVLSTIDGLARVRIAEMIGGDQEAFALLFSAAPDLMAALKLAVKELKAWQKDHGEDIKTQEAIAFACEAIAKVKKEDWD